MAHEANVSVRRGVEHSVTSPAVPVRFEDISPITIASAGGSIPNDSLWLFSRTYPVDIQQGDLLTDLTTGEVYRASGKPMRRDNSYLQIMVDQNVSQTS